MGRKLKWYKLLPVKQKTANSNLALPAMTTKQLGNIGEAKTLAKLVSMVSSINYRLKLQRSLKITNLLLV